MAAAIAHTIAVVDKSGKVISTSKQLRNVFMEAKFAYQERKAEIVADRKAKAGLKHDKDLRRAVKDLRIEDSPSERSSTSRRHHGHHKHHEPERRSRPDGLGRVHSGSSVGSTRQRAGSTSPRSPASPYARSPYAETVTSNHSHSAPTSPSLAQHRNRRSLDLVRRNTDMDLARLPRATRQGAPVRSMSATAIDMDLAYGDYHPSSIAPLAHKPHYLDEEKELLTLVDRAKLLLDEANCAQHSVKAMIEHLQKNPDAMAAVALTLAEISNIATKMAPSALTVLKGSAPAVFALLASPQFLIAAGVGIGVTVVMFGGYKIIKKIKAKNATNKEGSMDEALEINGEEINRINAWRRGIVASNDEKSDIASVGTSVDGEFITPIAASMRGMETRENILAGMSERESRRVEKKREKKESKEIKERRKTARKAITNGGSGSEMGSEKSGSSKRSSKLGIMAEDSRRALVKVKKPSPLRRLLA
ncbi:hypothetical protein GJ744_009944 [Endocarpon pusillum]|uniref:Uncharacterized protein n=1 Tax=Endocarpon pusillum TaxID=364733 RepID=A0A8H7E445_9EURO|nr:hypothetical protein GJ744_009944 [Endocarpon pusillum]